MIIPEQFQEIGETLLPLLDDLTEWIARDMIERFMIRFGRGEKKLLTGTDEWQAWVLEQAGGNLDEIQKALAKSTGKSQQEIAKIFKDSGIQAAKADAEAAAVTFSGLSPGMMAIITDAYERTVGEISNITRTTAGTTNQAFIDICDAAYWKVRTGAQSYTAAMLEGVKALGQLQPTVRYPSGHKDTLEVAVLRCIRTGVAQSSGNMTIQQCKDMGWNHVLVSQHVGARVSDTDPIADHAGWQGKVYCIAGKDTQFDNLLDATGYPENPLGLCGYNCRHSFTPFLPGVSQNHNKPIDTEANRRAYELSQAQRAMERRIRAQKRKCAALHTAVKNCEDPAAKAKLQEKYAQSAKRLQEQNAAYTKFCADSDLKPYHERLAVAGWDRSAASTASAATRARQKIDDAQNLPVPVTKAVENPEKSGTIISIRKPVEIPDDLEHLLKAETNFDGKDIDVKVLQAIDDSISASKAIKDDFNFNEIKIARFPADDKSVFITEYEVLGGKKRTKLYLNTEFFTGNTLESLDKMCYGYYTSGWWKSKTVGDLVSHEIMHARINYCNSFEKVERLYSELKDDARTSGFCRLVDNDPAEFLNEMYVAMCNSEKVDQKYVEVFNEYVKEFLGG